MMYWPGCPAQNSPRGMCLVSGWHLLCSDWKTQVCSMLVVCHPFNDLEVYPAGRGGTRRIQNEFSYLTHHITGVREMKRSPTMPCPQDTYNSTSHTGVTKLLSWPRPW